MKLDSAFRTSFIQVSYDRTYPCKHCKQHEEKIQYAVKVQEGEEKICPVLFIKKAPGNVCNKVKVCRYKKSAVAGNKSIAGFW